MKKTGINHFSLHKEAIKSAVNKLLSMYPKRLEVKHFILHHWGTFNDAKLLLLLQCWCGCYESKNWLVCLCAWPVWERERERHTWMLSLISLLKPKLILTQQISTRPDPVTHSGSAAGSLQQTDLHHILPTLTFLVPEEEGLLCWIWPLEGGVIIIIHSAGHVSRAALDRRHILGDGELSLATCRETDKERETGL